MRELLGNVHLAFCSLILFFRLALLIFILYVKCSFCYQFFKKCGCNRPCSNLDVYIRATLTLFGSYNRSAVPCVNVRKHLSYNQALHKAICFKCLSSSVLEGSVECNTVLLYLNWYRFNKKNHKKFWRTIRFITLTGKSRYLFVQAWEMYLYVTISFFKFTNTA